MFGFLLWFKRVILRNIFQRVLRAILEADLLAWNAPAALAMVERSLREVGKQLLPRAHAPIQYILWPESVSYIILDNYSLNWGPSICP